ncbi:Kinesin-like protein kif21b, partial [Coemansia sp. S17]
MVPRAIGAIWSSLEAKSKRHPAFTYSLDVSFLELYNEDLVDLLNPRSPTAGGSGGGRGPTIREDSRGNMVLVGVERKLAAGEDDIITYLHQGALSRTTASTDMNHTSSRSHAIFTIYLTQQDRRSSLILSNGSAAGLEASELDSGMSIVSKIHFVDLAGSERIKRTGAAGDRAKEGISINAGLLALGNVISALGSMTVAPGGTSAGAGGPPPRRGTMHVPYRDSKLTRLLQDSLGGNSQTLMLACISPSDRNSPESLNTIRYANRARNIRNKVAVNFDKNSSVELSMLKTEVARLRGELSKLKLQRRQSTLTLNGTADSNGDVSLSASVAMRKNADLTQRLEQALRRAAALEHERNMLRLRVAELGGSNQSTPNIPPASFPDFAPPIGRADDSGLRPNGSTNDSGLTDATDVMSQSNVLSTMDRELSEQAERHEHQIDSVRRHFTSRLELVQESLLVVQKERDVALQRLVNANLPPKSELRAGSTAAAAAAASGRGSSTSAPNRRALGIDIAPVGTTTPTTPTKLRLPSRATKNMRHEQSTPSTPLSRMASGAELRSSAAKPFAQLTRMGSSSGIGLAACNSQDEHSPQMRKLQDEIDWLKRENKRVAENSSTETERLTLQIQEQAKEISRLRRQHTGRRESDRYALLPFKENSWGAAKSAAAASSSSSAAHHHMPDGDTHSGDRGRRDEGSGPNLLRAAYIKAVVENELQRCVRARQLLRERDSFLAEQDQLMNQQNDLLLSMQNLQQDSETALASDEEDTTGDDEYKSMQMQRVSEKIEIIDAELHHLDLKVRDAEAEVAQLAEAAPATDDASNLNASGLLVAPAIINMSGLAMRMVEDVVRVDYRAFVDLFQGLPQADSTGLAYLLMQDIIEHRLVALRDARERASLEEQAMDLRRTLLAMQKTALNAALSYERELGDAERKLDQLLPPPSLPFAHQLSRRGSAIRTGECPNDGLDYGFDKPGEGAAAPACEAAVLDRSIYEGVRERGILLRSALISALEAPPLGSEASTSTSRLGRSDAWDGGASADN